MCNVLASAIKTKTPHLVGMMATGLAMAANLHGTVREVPDGLRYVKADLIETSVRPVSAPVTAVQQFKVDQEAEVSTVVRESPEQLLLQAPAVWTEIGYFSNDWYEAFHQFGDAIAHPDGWDGPGSQAASIETANHAFTILDSLSRLVPQGPAPLVGLDSDGAIVLTWRDGELIGSASVFEDGALAYYVERAGVSVSSGDFQIVDTAPSELVSILLG